MGALAHSIEFEAIRNAPNADVPYGAFVTHAATFFIKIFGNVVFLFIANFPWKCYS